MKVISLFGAELQLSNLEFILILILLSLIAHFIFYIVMAKKYGGVYDNFTILSISDKFIPPFIEESSLPRKWTSVLIYIAYWLVVPVYCIIGTIAFIVYLLRNEE